MRRWKVLLLLLLLAVNSGCLSVKLNGFEEIANRNEVGMEHATSTPEGTELIRQLGLYISEIEFQIEKQ
jgi:hypothetical protein